MNKYLKSNFNCKLESYHTLLEKQTIIHLRTYKYFNRGVIKGEEKEALDIFLLHDIKENMHASACLSNEKEKELS